MTRIFDGIADIINSVFGDTVTITPDGQPPRVIQGTLREEPLEVLDQDGRAVTTVDLWIKASADDVADLRRGDLIVSGAGVQYRYESKLPTGSPASDALVIISLEEI